MNISKTLLSSTHVYRRTKRAMRAQKVADYWKSYRETSWIIWSFLYVYMELQVDRILTDGVPERLEWSSDTGHRHHKIDNVLVIFNRNN